MATADTDDVAVRAEAALREACELDGFVDAAETERAARWALGEIEGLRNAGDRLARAVCSLDSYAAASFPCPTDRSEEARAALEAWTTEGRDLTDWEAMHDAVVKERNHLENERQVYRAALNALVNCHDNPQLLAGVVHEARELLRDSSASEQSDSCEGDV